MQEVSGSIPLGSTISTDSERPIGCLNSPFYAGHSMPIDGDQATTFNCIAQAPVP